ncbi:MAG: O-antigen ligase family protein [Caldilineales bacterium]
MQAITGGGQTIWAGEVFNRVYGLAGGPFTLAYFLVLLIPLALVFFIESSPGDGESGVWQFRKGLLAVLLVGAGAALLLTFIRGAWFALVFAILLLGLLRGSLRYRQLLLTIPVVAGGVLIAFSPALDRLEQVADPTSTLFGRIEVWKLAADWITTSPLVFLGGLGMKAFEYFYILQAAPRVAGLYWRREAFLIGNRPHNEILGFWLDVGLIGLIAFIVALFIVIRQAWRIFRRSEDQPLRLFALAFIIGAAGIFFGAMGDNVFSQPSVASYFWIMAGLIMAISKHMMPAPDEAAAES